MNDLLQDDDLESKSITKIYNPCTHAEEVSNTLVSASELEEDLLEFRDDITLETCTEYLVENVIDKKSLVAIYGAPGSGKTFLALDLADALASGREAWHGKKIKGCSVLYVCLEGVSGFKRRILAVNQEFGSRDRKLARVKKHIHLKNNDEGRNGANLISKAAKDLANQSKSETNLIIIDTMSQAMAGDDENSSADMMGVVSKARDIINQTGATVLFIHHSGKDTDRGMRGSSALLGACDTVIRVSNDNKIRKAEIEKSKDGEIGSLLNFKLRPVMIGVNEEGTDITSCVIETVKTPITSPSRKNLSLNGRIALEQFHEIEEKKQVHNQVGIPDGAAIATEKQWKEKCRNKGIGHSDSEDETEARKIENRAIDRAIQNCIRHGVIAYHMHQGQKVYWCPNKQIGFT